MVNNKYDGYLKGLYNYMADCQDDIKYLFTTFLDVNPNCVKISFRRQDLEIMVMVKFNITDDSIILFTVNRLDEYRFNYDNKILLNNIFDSFKINDRHKKILKIKNRIDDNILL